MITNPVAVAVDTDGSVLVTETTRRKVADIDIREVTWWIPDDLSHTSVDEKRDFFHRNVTSSRFKNHPSVKDHNRDGRIDWKDLTFHSEKIHRLTDTDGDGVADKSTLFAEGFNTEVTGIAAGVLARRGDVYATIAPDLWKLRDNDGDGVADERTSLAHGFGFHINYAGHDMHGLTFGPDGKVYWTIGDKGTNVTSGETRWIYPHEGALLRCNPDGTDFEVFARGLRNVQEIAFDDHGNIFGVDNDSDQKGEKERLLYIVEGSDTGWRAYYQYRGGKYNPWMAERIAFPDGDDRPASILPPLALYLDGPSGFAYNPGTALNERYRGHFFLTQFPAGKINAFKLEPEGAAYRIAGDQLMAGGAAFTGCNFGPDGALYVADWGGGYPLNDKGAVWKIDDPQEAGSATRKEVAAFLKEGPSKVTEVELVKRLAHRDQRVRLDAQWELAERKSWDALVLVAASPDAALLARIHALWALSQGKRFDGKLFRRLSESDNPEIRAQAAKWAGDCGPPVPDLGPLLADPSARVRLQAALSVGRLRANILLPEIVTMLAENDNKDRYLSHAGAHALREAGAYDPEVLSAAAGHPSRSVRLAVTVGIRNILQDQVRQVMTSGAGGSGLDPAPHINTLERLLLDSDPYVAAEAARAIYESPGIQPAFPALASMLETRRAARPSALRRAISANRRIGDEASLLRLARFAANESTPIPLRVAALEALASAKSREPLDAVDGHYAPLEPLEVAAPVVARIAATLTPASGNQELAKQVASALDALGAKHDDAALTGQALDPELDPDLRLAALRHLKDSGAEKWGDTALAMLKQDAPALRPQVAGMLATERAAAAMSYIKHVGLKSPDLAERQAVVRLLPSMDGAKPVLDALLADLRSGKLDPALQLEVLESAEALQLDDVHATRAGLAAGGFPGKWAFALSGGDAAAGRKVFEENLASNCTACHRIGEEGSNVGPPLTHAGAKGGRYLLESLVSPQAKIASGFGLMTITRKDGSVAAGAFLEEKDHKLALSQPDGSRLEVPLEDIATKTEPVSTMPPMGDILKPTELRDLVAFLSSLK
nr:PVC-type heme-binding CxxCH protein [Luteolibacter marinus]